MKRGWKREGEGMAVSHDNPVKRGQLVSKYLTYSEYQGEKVEQRKD